MSTDAPGMGQVDRLGHAFLEAAPDAIVVADGEGLIRFWNPGAARIFGFAPAEAVGQSLDIIIPEPQRAQHWAGFRHVMAPLNRCRIRFCKGTVT
jgi:PAS domain S-box-containing protein